MLLALVAGDQFRFVAFARHWINEDQTLLWYAARDLGAGRIPQPSFYGQAYLTTWEAAPAEVARWLGVPLWTGVPMATAALVIGPCVAAAAGAMVAALLVTLAAPKALDGTASAWLSFGRHVHLLPAALWFVAVVATEDRARRAAPAAAVTVVAIAVASFAARQVTFDQRFEEIVDVGRATAGAPVTPLRDTIDRCEDVRGARSALVVFRYDRTGAYACGAIDYRDRRTLFPAYERRTWLLRDEARRTRSTFAFTEADDDACRRIEASSGATCERDDTIAVVHGGRIDVVDVWRRAGEEVRSFGDGGG